MATNIEELRRLVREGIEKRYCKSFLPLLAYDERLGFELDFMEKYGRVDYMLLAKKIVDVVTSAGGIVGPGRGAAPASMVCYALGITDVWSGELLFEQFMNESQNDKRTFVCIDVDKRGYEAFRSWLDASGYEWSIEERRTMFAPECFIINGMSIGVTHVTSLDLMAEVKSLLAESGKPYPDFANIEVLDHDAMLVFALGESGDIPGYEAPGLRNACFEIGPFDIGELENLYALSYPGNLAMRPEYIRRRCGTGGSLDSKDEYYRHPMLRSIFESTLGIQIYHEQIILTVRKLGGFSRCEAYKCQRAIGKLMLEKIAAYKAKFIDGCLENAEFRKGGFADEAKARNTATEIWNDLERYGRYSFMRAHCVAAANLAYRLSYLKAHYPAEWVFAKAKCALYKAEQPKTEKIPKQFDYNHIRMALEQGSKVTLLIRHAERPPLDPSDTSFGEKLSITESGKDAARRLGLKLADMIPPKSVKFCASGTFRTIQTACSIMDGLYGEHDINKRYDVSIEDVLGGGSPFFGDLDERMALIGKGEYMKSLNGYFKTGEVQGYRPLKGATAAMQSALEAMHGKDSNLVIAVTHDINVAAFLAGKGVVTEFDLDKWPHYLDAVGIIDDGFEKEFGCLRWDTMFDRIDL